MIKPNSSQKNGYKVDLASPEDCILIVAQKPIMAENIAAYLSDCKMR